MHRLRRVRGGVPKCICHALHRSESLTSVARAPGKSRTRHARSENGARDGCRRFWQLHQHLRMRSGLSGRDQRQFHRETESRICKGAFTRQRGGLGGSRALSRDVRFRAAGALFNIEQGTARSTKRFARADPKLRIDFGSRPLGNKIYVHVWAHYRKNRRARA
jgi:hypothetical protein